MQRGRQLRGWHVRLRQRPDRVRRQLRRYDGERGALRRLRQTVRDGSTCMAGTCSAGSRPAGCPAAAALLSDFEEGTGVLVKQGGRDGWWYVFADTSAGSQTPASSNMAVAAALLSPAGGDCNKYAMHSTASGHPSYVGFGATLSPGTSASTKKVVSLETYTGVSFKAKSGSGTAPPIWFEFLNKETQPGASCPDCGQR